MLNDQNNSENVNSENLNSEKEVTIKTPKVVKEKKEKKNEGNKDEKNLSSLLDKFKTEKSSASAKSSIYRNIDYSKLSEKDKRKTRKQLRKGLDAQIIAMKQAIVNKKEVVKQFAIFDKYYKSTYSVNDYSISSLYGGEINSYQYEYISNFIAILKATKLIK